MIIPVPAILIAVIVWQKRLPRRRSLVAAFGILGFGTLPLSAAAQQATGAAGDFFTAVVNYSVTTDSNLFRQPGSANPRSDTINAASAVLRADKTYSQQRFQLEVSENLTRYNNSSYLNFDATNYRGSWLWSPTPGLNASFSADRSKSLAPFEDTLTTQRNVSIHESWAFNLDGRIFGGWNWLAGISRSDQKSEQAIVNLPDQRTDSAEAGIKYLTQSGNSIAVTQRSSKGNYQNQGTTPGVNGNNFSQDENELKGDWKLSEKSELTGRVARLKRTNNQIGQRNFSGVSGDLAYTWKPTSKLGLNVSANRNTSSLQDPSFSYIVNDSLSITPTWQVTEKISAHMRLQRANSGYQGKGIVPATGPARRDTTDSAEIGVDWSPMNKLSVNVSLQQQRRSSNNTLFEYDDKIAKISASWAF